MTMRQEEAGGGGVGRGREREEKERIMEKRESEGTMRSLGARQQLWRADECIPP